MTDNNENPPLNLPGYDFKLRKEGNTIKIYDFIRRKYVALTPEEYVRQHFVNWLCTELGYPPSIVANEVRIHLNETQRRCDTVIFNPGSEPLMIVEYKAPDIALSQATFDQIVRYNMVLRARYLVVSNGMKHYCCVMDYKNNTYNFIPRIPAYSEVIMSLREN